MAKHSSYSEQYGTAIITLHTEKSRKIGIGPLPQFNSEHNPTFVYSEGSPIVFKEAYSQESVTQIAASLRSCT